MRRQAGSGIQREQLHLLKRSRKQTVVLAACVSGATMCFSLVLIFLLHAALTGVWTDKQTGELRLFSL